MSTLLSQRLQQAIEIAELNHQQRAIAKQARQEIKKQQKIQQQQMRTSRSDLWKQVKQQYPNQTQLRWPAVSAVSIQAFIRQQEDDQQDVIANVAEQIDIDNGIADLQFGQRSNQQYGADNLWTWIQQQNYRPGQILQHAGQPYQFQTNSRLFAHIWITSAYDEDYDQVYEAEELDIDDNDVMFLNQQMFQFGDQNCVLGPIMDQLKQKAAVALEAGKMGTYKNLQILIKKCNLLTNSVKYGASVELMQTICDSINCRIVIQNPVTDYQLDIKSTRSVFPSYTFEFLNVQRDHVEYYANMKNGKDPILLSNDQIYDKKQELKDSGQLFLFKKSFSSDMYVNQIQQGPDKYIREDYYMLKKAVQRLNNDQQNLQICVTEPQLQFINNCLAYPDKVKFDTGSFNGWRDSYCQYSDNQYHAIPVYDPPGIFDEFGTQLNYSHALYYHKNKTITHIDCKSGYTQHRNIEQKYRRGFPFITDYRIVKDINFCLEYNGLYMVKITWTRNSDKVIQTLLKSKENVNNIYYLITPIIQFLVDNGIDVVPLAGMYGKSNRSIEYEQDAFIEYDSKKAYYVQCSQNACDETADILQHIYCGDRQFIECVDKSVDRQKYNIYKSTDRQGGFIDGEYILQTKIDHTRTQYNTSKHVTAFIIQYQQLNVMLQLKKLKYDSILQVSCDDIYYTEYDGHKDDILPIFREKKFDSEIYKICYTQSLDVYCTQYKTNTDELQLQEIYQECGELQQEYNQYQLHLGPGGFGKTHLQQNDKGSIGKYYLTLTNQLVDDQKLQYKNTKCLTKDMFKILHGRQQLPSNPTNIIVDEIGLVDPNILVYIKHYFPHSKIYALGDKLQLKSPFPDTEPVNHKIGDFFDESQYDKIYDNYTTDYRTTDEALRALKVKIRQWMLDSNPFNEVKMFDLLTQHCARLQKVPRNQLKSQYDPRNLLVVSTKAQQQTYNKLLEDHTKFRCKETFTRDGVRYYTGQVFLEKPFESNKFEQQHGYTCHSLQGQTFRGDKLYITRPVLSEHVDFTGFLYTAISRCISFDQLVFVI